MVFIFLGKRHDTYYRKNNGKLAIVKLIGKRSMIYEKGQLV